MANEFYTGQTGQDRISIPFDLGTIDTGTAYTAGDLLHTPIVIPNAARFAGFSGRVESLTIVEQSPAGTAQKPGLRVWVFAAPAVSGTRNSPINFTAANLEQLAGYFTIGSGQWINTSTAVAGYSVQLLHPGIPYQCPAGSFTLIVACEVTTAPTFASGTKFTGMITIVRD